MALLKVDNLQALVKSKYASARKAKALNYTPSQTASISVGESLFQLRYCPGLAKKPHRSDNKAKPPTTVRVDPFEDPCVELLVARLPLHNIVLNKFPIIQNHFILATKQNKLQTHRLEEDDLVCTYECLRSWEMQSDGRLFAFFNSGEYSGASQPRRHLQFLPVEDMEDGQASRGWSLLVDSIMSPDSTRSEPFKSFQFNPGLPFFHFGAHLPANPSSSLLQQTYSNLYDAAAAVVYEFVKSHPNDLELHSIKDGSLPISYNLAITTSAMVICPRRSEGQMVRRPDGTDVGFVALNGTVLAGTLMVKDEELFTLLSNDSSALNSVLESIGIPHSEVVSAQL